MTFGEDSGWGVEPRDLRGDPRRLPRPRRQPRSTPPTSTPTATPRRSSATSSPPAPACATAWCSARSSSPTCIPGDPNGGGGGRKALIGQLEESLRRLQTDYVDLYWLHGWDRSAPIEETLRALDDLVAAGKVRYIGLSDVPAWVAARAQTIAELRGWTPITALQLEYSLLERTPEGELLPMAQALGIGGVPWSPLRSGKLSGKYAREDGVGTTGRGAVITAVFGEGGEHDWDVIETVAQVAQNLGVSSAEVALSWIRERPGISSTLIGARTLDQLRANLASLDVTLTAEHRATLDEVSTPTLPFPARFTAINAAVAFGGMTVDGASYPAITVNGKQRRGEY